MPASQVRRATPGSPQKRSATRRARLIDSAWTSCHPPERMSWLRLWRWRISSAATVKYFARSIPVILGTSSAASWVPSRRAGRRCSAAMSSSAMIAGPPASPTTHAATVTKCQGLARAKWLADRQAELLPVPYFHVVFTLPASAAEIAFQNKTVVYAMLFRAATYTCLDRLLARYQLEAIERWTFP